MGKEIWLKDGFDQAAAALDSVLDYAVGSLESPLEGEVSLPALEALTTPVPASNADERNALMKAAGLTSAPHSTFMQVPGFGMGVLRERVERNKSARAGTLPQGALWAIAGAGIAGTPRQRCRAKKVSVWVQSRFLLSGGRITTDLADLGTLWTMVSIALQAEALRSLPGASALASIAADMAARHPVLQVIDQFICCEIARAVRPGMDMPENHPLLALPLIAAPRYGLKYSGKKGRGKGEPEATFRQVPADLEPYIFLQAKV